MLSFVLSKQTLVDEVHIMHPVRHLNRSLHTTKMNNSQDNSQDPQSPPSDHQGHDGSPINQPTQPSGSSGSLDIQPAPAEEASPEEGRSNVQSSHLGSDKSWKRRNHTFADQKERLGQSDTEDVAGPSHQPPPAPQPRKLDSPADLSRAPSGMFEDNHSEGSFQLGTDDPSSKQRTEGNKGFSESNQLSSSREGSFYFGTNDLSSEQRTESNKGFSKLNQLSSSREGSFQFGTNDPSSEQRTEGNEGLSESDQLSGSGEPSSYGTARSAQSAQSAQPSDRSSRGPGSSGNGGNENLPQRPDTAFGFHDDPQDGGMNEPPATASGDQTEPQDTVAARVRRFFQGLPNAICCCFGIRREREDTDGN